MVSSAQSLTRAEGQSLGSLDIRVLSEAQPNAPGHLLLQGVELVPLELTGRTVAQDMQAECSHLATRNGFRRVELPRGGRLFHYRRLGGQQWGYLHIPPNGAAAVAIELAGVGTGNIVDPFQDRIGVAPDGSFAVAPVRSGGCYVIRLDGGTFASTGTAARFVSTTAPILPSSMMVGRSCAFFRTGTGTGARIWRMPLVDGGTPTSITPTIGSRDVLGTELALSGNGSKVVFALGPQSSANLWLVDETHPPLQLPTLPLRYEEPQYLPEGNGHANLLLNTDGSRLFWFEGGANEMYLMDLTATPPRSFQFSGDAFLERTIGVHILPSFVGATLLIALGDAVGATNMMDWFQVDMNATGGSVVNLTATGSTTTPYLRGSLTPLQSGVVGGKLLATNAVTATQQLRSFDPATSQAQLLYTDLLQPPELGGAFGRAPDVVVHGAGDRVFQGSTGTLLGELPPGVFVTPPSGGPNYNATWVHFASNWGVVALYLNDGTLVTGPFEFGVRQVVQTLTGAIVTQGATTRLVLPRSITTMPIPQPPIAVFLSGAGA